MHITDVSYDRICGSFKDFKPKRKLLDWILVPTYEFNLNCISVLIATFGFPIIFLENVQVLFASCFLQLLKCFELQKDFFLWKTSYYICYCNKLYWLCFWSPFWVAINSFIHMQTDVQLTHGMSYCGTWSCVCLLKCVVVNTHKASVPSFVGS